MNSPIRHLILLNALCLVCAGIIARAEDASNTTMTSTNAAAFTTNAMETATNTAMPAATSASNAAGAGTNATFSISIRDCITRALQNNFEIRIQRLNPSIQSWGITLAQGAFDPVLSASAEYTDSVLPSQNGFSSISTNGTVFTTNLTMTGSAARTLTLSPSVGVGGTFASGARYDLSASPVGRAPSLRDNFVYSGEAAFSVAQPLLKNFGFDVNTAQIRIARKGQQIAIHNFINQVITSISTVESAYYELVFSIEDQKAKLDDLTLAKQLLDETRRKVQIGVSSPLDVTTAESGVASREEAVILADRTIKDNENALKLLISQNVMEFRNVSFVPVDYPVVETVVTDVDRSIRVAMQKRPDYLAAINNLERQNIQIKFSRNQLWPELDVNGSYGLNGVGGSFDDWNDSVASRNYPVWAAGVSLTFPLGNRQARANYQSARLTADQLLLQLKQLEQQIVVGVDNAAGHVETNLKSVDAAVVARRLAEESYQAERTKLQAGTSTTLNVLTQESALADARSREIRARASYSESLVALAQAEGTTLERHNIVLNERF